MVQTTKMMQTQGRSGPVLDVRATPYNPREMPMQAANFMPGVRSFAKSMDGLANRNHQSEQNELARAQREKLARARMGHAAKMQQQRIAADKAAADLAYKRETGLLGYKQQMRISGAEEMDRLKYGLAKERDKFGAMDDSKLAELGLSPQEIAQGRASGPGGLQSIIETKQKHERDLALRARIARAGSGNPLQGKTPEEISKQYGVPPQLAEAALNDASTARKLVTQYQKTYEFKKEGNKMVGSFDDTANLIQNTPPEVMARVFGVVRGTDIAAHIRDLRGADVAVSTFYKQLSQYTQGLKSANQRMQLKGGGSITDAERAQVDKIIGDVLTARDPNQALQLLETARRIVSGKFLDRQALDALPGYTQQQPGDLDAPPSDDLKQLSTQELQARIAKLRAAQQQQRQQQPPATHPNPSPALRRPGPQF